MNVSNGHHSVSGSTSQPTVMVLDKKLINFGTSKKQEDKPMPKENSRKLLTAKPVNSSFSANKPQNPPTSSTEVDLDKTQENQAAENIIIQSYKS